MENTNIPITETEARLTGEIVQQMQHLSPTELVQTLTFLHGVSVGRAVAANERVS